MKKYILPFFLLSLLFSVQAIAQVTIAPTNLFIDSQTRFGTYMVINGSNAPQEISIDFFFGYSETDDNGLRTNITGNEEMAAQYSIADEVRAFPQNFVLQPGQRQIVRLRINAPNTIPDGMYWARIRTTSTPESAPLELTGSDEVSARVGIKIEQVTGLFYRKGAVSTGIEIDGIRTQLDDQGRLVVLSDIRRIGNSPFLGSITTNLTNASGQVVREAYVSTTIHFDGVHQQTLGIENLPVGNYTINVTFESKRSDISASDLAQMPTVTESTTFTIQ